MWCEGFRNRLIAKAREMQYVLSVFFLLSPIVTVSEANMSKQRDHPKEAVAGNGFVLEPFWATKKDNRYDGYYSSAGLRDPDLVHDGEQSE